MKAICAPPALIVWLGHHHRNESILGHRIEVNLDWWNPKLQSYGHALSGMIHGVQTVQGKAEISRSDIFKLDAGTDSLLLLWNVLAWGSGTRSRNNRLRMASVDQNVKRAEGIIQSAALAASQSAFGGYASMRTGRHSNAIKFIGPAFFTKILYFAGRGRPEHPCLIVDARVLATLSEVADDNAYKYRFGYPMSTYTQSVDLMKAWAEDASEKLDRYVAPDEVERWAFEANGNVQ